MVTFGVTRACINSRGRREEVGGKFCFTLYAVLSLLVTDPYYKKKWFDRHVKNFIPRFSNTFGQVKIFNLAFNI